MKLWLAGLALLFCPVVFAQQSVPEIPFDSVPNVPDMNSLPANVFMGEGAAVTTNSKGHIFVFSRGNTSGPAYAAQASQLLEFGPDGKFIREIGHNLYGFAFANAVVLPFRRCPGWMRFFPIRERDKAETRKAE